MDWMIEVFSGLPASVSGIFATVIILGMVFIFFWFLSSIIKHYMDRRNGGSGRSNSPEFFNKIVEIHGKIGELGEKFASKEDLNNLEEKVNQTRESLSELKGNLGI